MHPFAVPCITMQHWFTQDSRKAHFTYAGLRIKPLWARRPQANTARICLGDRFALVRNLYSRAASPIFQILTFSVPPTSFARYVRHRPETTLLYQIVREYWPEFQAELASQGKHLPTFICRGFDECQLSCRAWFYRAAFALRF